MFSDVPAALSRQFSMAERQAPEYLGLSAEGAQALATQQGVEEVRIVALDGDGPVRLHQDHRPCRLNLVVLDRAVVRAAFY